MGKQALTAAVWGTGRAGVELVRVGSQHSWLRYAAGVVTNPDKEGRDLGEIAGVEYLGAPVTTDAASVLAREDLDVVFYAGLGTEAEVGRRVLDIVRAGKNAVTVSGMVHPPSALGENAAKELHEACLANGVRAFGTGINPGFLLDVLPAVWLSTEASYRRITARRISDMRTWGPGVHHDEGIGLRPEDLGERETHMTLDQSLLMIRDAAGVTFDEVRVTHEPIISPTRREFRETVVEPGTVTGYRRRAAGIVGGEERIVLEWTAVFMLDPEVDGVREEGLVEVDGDPWLEMRFTGGVFEDPYPATVARAINTLPALLSMPPGLYDGTHVPFAPRRGYR